MDGGILFFIFIVASILISLLWILFDNMADRKKEPDGELIIFEDEDGHYTYMSLKDDSLDRFKDGDELVLTIHRENTQK